MSVLTVNCARRGLDRTSLCRIVHTSLEKTYTWPPAPGIFDNESPVVEGIQVDIGDKPHIRSLNIDDRVEIELFFSLT